MTGVTSLPGALRAHAQGLYCLDAAVKLLIGHAAWLQHEDFLRDFVRTVPRPAGSSPIAVIDWPQAITSLAEGRLPSSGRAPHPAHRRLTRRRNPR